MIQHPYRVNDHAETFTSNSRGQITEDKATSRRKCGRARKSRQALISTTSFDVMAAPTDIVDGVEAQGPLSPGSTSGSLAAELARFEAVDTAGPTTLLGMAARMTTASGPDAVGVLRRLGFPPTRARTSVRYGSPLAWGSAHDPLGFLAGSALSDAAIGRLRSLLPTPVAADGAPSPRLCARAARAAWSRSRVGALARTAASSRDGASQLVAAALLAATRPVGDSEFVAGLTEALHRTFGSGTRMTQAATADHVLTTAYALDAAGNNGLPLGSARWTGGSKKWRMDAALWLLPILDPELPQAVEQLLRAAEARGLQFKSPDSNAERGDVKVNAHARNLATSVADALTQWAGRPMWFDGGPGGWQVLLTEDDYYAYAWVGKDNKGSLVCFDTEDFYGYALDDPASTFALPIALGWYVDVAVTLRRSPGGSSTIKRSKGSSNRGGNRYVPRPTFTAQVASIGAGAKGSAPPAPHAVAAHIRRLAKSWHPNPETVELAPPRLRRLMGPHDTYVQRHMRGGPAAIAEARARLSRLSALGDIAGMFERAKGK